MQKMMIVLAMSLGLLIACSRETVPKPKVDAVQSSVSMASLAHPLNRR